MGRTANAAYVVFDDEMKFQRCRTRKLSVNCGRCKMSIEEFSEMRLEDVLKDTDSMVDPLYACKMPHSVSPFLLGHP